MLDCFIIAMTNDRKETESISVAVCFGEYLKVFLAQRKEHCYTFMKLEMSLRDLLASVTSK